MARYYSERKPAILNKLLPPSNVIVAQVSRACGVLEQTHNNWRDKARELGLPLPGRTPATKQWLTDAKLALIIESEPRSESALSQYCRERGLYPEQITE